MTETAAENVALSFKILLYFSLRKNLMSLVDGLLFCLRGRRCWGRWGMV